MPSVAAFDLSLTRSAACVAGRLDVLETKDARGHERLEQVLRWARGHYVGATVGNIDLIAIEGYAYARANQAHQIGELGGLVRHDLWKAGVTYLEVAPSSVKTYATGKGNASKDEVQDAAYRRGGGLYTGSSNDEADVFWIWALVMDLAGAPVIDLPKNHRRALDAIDLPTGVAA